MRIIYRTPEYDVFFESVDDRTKKKIEYILDILTTEKVIKSKVAKKLTNADFYELRIQVQNEYRIITFGIDHTDLNQCKEIVLITGFMKKSTKDYKKEIQKAIKILEQWTGQN